MISTGKTLLINDLANDTTVIGQHFGCAEHTRSLLATPLRLGQHIIGMISAQSYMPLAYDDDDRILLDMLAAHAAGALDNARLYADLAHAYETTLEGWPRALDLRDVETEEHT